MIMTEREAEIFRLNQEHKQASAEWKAFARLNWSCLQITINGDNEIAWRPTMQDALEERFKRLKWAACQFQAAFHDGASVHGGTRDGEPKACETDGGRDPQRIRFRSGYTYTLTPTRGAN